MVKKNPKTDVLVQNKWDIEGSRNGECGKEVTVVLDCSNYPKTAENDQTSIMPLEWHVL